MQPDNPSTEPDDLPPLPEPVEAVIHREPCLQCGNSSFGYVASGHRDDLTVNYVAEYHNHACPVVARGAYVIGVFPESAVDLAGEIERELMGQDW